MKSFLKRESPAPDTPIPPVRVIDPSLFTAPYDAALVAALRRAGVDAELVGRPLRAGETAPGVSRHSGKWFKTRPHTSDDRGRPGPRAPHGSSHADAGMPSGLGT